MLIMSVVDSVLASVESACYSKTRQDRRVTATNAKYVRLISGYSKQLMVSSSCIGFTLYGGTRDTFGCAYSALGTSGAVVDVNSDGRQRTYSFPAPWRMIQCTLSGECSSLLFTQIWLSEWTVEKTTADEMLRHNFVNHTMIEVTVDSTFSIRLVISLQILALVVTAYLTSVRGWYKMKSSFISPWAKVMNATTSFTIPKVVRSSYNVVLVAQMALGILQWRKQLTIDLLVGADINQAVLRAFGCGTLVVVLAINFVFARAGDLKMQEMEPSFAQVCDGYALCISGQRYKVFGLSWLFRLRYGDIAECLHCGSYRRNCKGNIHWVDGPRHTSSNSSGNTKGWSTIRGSRRSFHIGSSQRESICPDVNSFTRFLDDRSRRTSLYDCSTEVYVQVTGGTLLSTRGQLEASGFVLASSILFRYRDLPLLLVARVLPVQILNFFNLTVITYELIDTNKELNGVPVRLVADQVIHTHWSKLQDVRLDGWMGIWW
ncbi:hypothetical protein P3T76_012005 [Phytophthora citrophthora]|uniref:Uncharacterized protein n=1 Tax=Phytophthora citrophthora TaxID=4793 RepID=A0AAD9LDI4_9STRA|nr:hypothetical protein P3T76_012005 [Phytophthora citrophthora]